LDELGTTDVAEAEVEIVAWVLSEGGVTVIVTVSTIIALAMYWVTVLASLAWVTVIVTKPPAAVGVKAETGPVDVDAGVTGTRAVDDGGVTKVELALVVDVIAVVDVWAGASDDVTEDCCVAAAGPPVVIGRNPDSGVGEGVNGGCEVIGSLGGLSAARDGSAVGSTRYCELSWISIAADSMVSLVTCEAM
jgi:hypothetical protein